MSGLIDDVQADDLMIDWEPTDEAIMEYEAHELLPELEAAENADIERGAQDWA